MPQRVAELYGHASHDPEADWPTVVAEQFCPFLGRRCLKTRKSSPELTIGTCSVEYSSAADVLMICPFRLLHRRQIFTDALHLLASHEPGNELHIVAEFPVPGGSIDYLLASVHKGRPVDFVGIELQTLDTTGTVWPARERFLRERGVDHDEEAATSTKRFGMNWKMTAKTILVQLHHKLGTFEHVNRKLVLVLQDRLFSYMSEAFSFGHLTNPPILGDPLHFHAYHLERSASEYKLELAVRASTDVAGMAQALGLQAEANVDLDQILTNIGQRISEKTLLEIT